MKILIIAENKHNTIGGIEKYNKTLIDLFLSNGHIVHEYSFNFNPEKENIFEPDKRLVQLNNIDNKNKLSIKEVRKNISICKKEIYKIWDQYDIVINSTANIGWKKEIYNSNKWVYVQHFNADFYKQKYIAGKLLQPIIYFGMWLVGIKNPFKKFKNFVFFSDDDKKSLIKNKKINYWIIPISPYTKKYIKSIKHNYNYDNKFIYFGRLDDFQKNIKWTSKIFKDNNLQIDFYGVGDTSLINETNLIKYKGPFDNKDLNKIIKKYNFNVLLSKYEGFPYSIVEAISHGVPVISTNNCKSINWLLKDCGWITSKSNINNILEKASTIPKDEYNKMSRNCLNFALNNLTKEKFDEKWLEIIFNISRRGNNE